MRNHGTLIAAGLLLGAGLGGFFDGIVFHQILQWHNMLSARIPPVDLFTAKLNMFWDGVFHAAVWLVTLAGVALLFRAGAQTREPGSGRALVGSGFLGWGLFNLIEGGLNHHLFGLHHVLDDGSNPLPADMAFLSFGLFLAIGGWLMLHSARAASEGAYATSAFPQHR